MEMWHEKVAEPYKGITSDGNVRKGLYKLQDEGAPVKEATSAAEALLEVLDDKQKQILSQDIESDIWRRWANRK